MALPTLFAFPSCVCIVFLGSAVDHHLPVLSYNLLQGYNLTLWPNRTDRRQSMKSVIGIKWEYFLAELFYHIFFRFIHNLPSYLLLLELVHFYRFLIFWLDIFEELDFSKIYLAKILSMYSNIIKCCQYFSGCIPLELAIDQRKILFCYLNFEARRC